MLPGPRISWVNFILQPEPGATVTPFVPTAEGCRWHVNEHVWHAFRNQSNTGLCVAMAFMMMLLHIQECGCLGLVSVGVILRNVMSMPFCPHRWVMLGVATGSDGRGPPVQGGHDPMPPTFWQSQSN